MKSSSELSLLSILNDWVAVNKPNWFIFVTPTGLEMLESAQTGQLYFRRGELRIRWMTGWIADIKEQEVEFRFPTCRFTLSAFDPQFFENLTKAMNEAEIVYAR